MSFSGSTKCPKCFQPLQVTKGPVGRSTSCPLGRHQFRLESFKAAADSHQRWLLPRRTTILTFWGNFEAPSLKSLGRFEIKTVTGVARSQRNPPMPLLQNSSSGAVNATARSGAGCCSPETKFQRIQCRHKSTSRQVSGFRHQSPFLEQ